MTDQLLIHNKLNNNITFIFFRFPGLLIPKSHHKSFKIRSVTFQTMLFQVLMSSFVANISFYKKEQ